jgi:hypothetical protein
MTTQGRVLVNRDPGRPTEIRVGRRILERRHAGLPNAESRAVVR